MGDLFALVVVLGHIVVQGSLWPLFGILTVVLAIWKVIDLIVAVCRLFYWRWRCGFWVFGRD